MDFFSFLKKRSLPADLFRLTWIHELRKYAKPFFWKDTLLFLLIVLASIVLSGILFEYGINREAAFMSGIFFLAALLWATEALPLFATAILIFGLEIILLSNPGGWEHFGFANGNNPSYKLILSPLSNPILVLFFGGFILAEAAVKQGVDKKLASIVLKLFGGKPIWVLLGLMSITAIFSMWISNTATTAMMITLIAPMLKQLPENAPVRKAFILSIPFAANIGGIGTPIGTVPNAVAIGFLRESNIEVGFLEWMIIAIPFVIILLFISWLLLWFFNKPKLTNVNIEISNVKIKPRGYFVMFIFAVTVILWLTENFHGLPSAIVALLPAIAFTMVGLIDRSDINSLEWHILLLIAGGIALGQGMKLTGLDRIIVGLLPSQTYYSFFIFGLAGILISTFISNTATANLILPIAISFAMISPNPLDVLIIGIGVAMSTSLAMALPVSTPPNAIAYAMGGIESKDFIKMGGIIGIIGMVLIFIFLRIFMEFVL